MSKNGTKYDDKGEKGNVTLKRLADIDVSAPTTGTFNPPISKREDAGPQPWFGFFQFFRRQNKDD
jgi:hypothetical protein